MSEAKAESIFKALERWKASSAREVEKRAGPMFADLVPCPCCVGTGPAPGFIFPVLPEPDQSMRRQMVLVALGGEPEPDYPIAQHVERCDVCDGWGMVASGSRVDNQKAVPCNRCAGQGHVQKVTVPPPPTVNAAPLWPPPAQPVGANGAQVTDPWGRPLGHPDYGTVPDWVTH